MAETEAPAAPRRAAADRAHLEAGDRVTRSEFERRYAACPHLKKAELIEGVVYLPSPVRYDIRGRVFPGLYRDVSALLRNDAAAALATMQAGIESAEHRDFGPRVGAG